jgi:hypothetical protein
LQPIKSRTTAKRQLPITALNKLPFTSTLNILDDISERPHNPRFYSYIPTEPASNLPNMARKFFVGGNFKMWVPALPRHLPCGVGRALEKS